MSMVSKHQMGVHLHFQKKRTHVTCKFVKSKSGLWGKNQTINAGSQK
jgi:hypothetical protein